MIRLLARRAAVHESGHAIAAICYSLPVREVIIDADGCGVTRYWAERFGRERAEAWVITTYAGPEAEHDIFGDSAAGGDLRAIDAMMQRLGLDWTERKLAGMRSAARRLVERERCNISTVADALIEHRHLTAADAKRLLRM